ncbi:hypothetical protein ACHQM5_021239 [Ranunculus cassubicifolius]
MKIIYFLCFRYYTTRDHILQRLLQNTIHEVIEPTSSYYASSRLPISASPMRAGVQLRKAKQQFHKFAITKRSWIVQKMTLRLRICDAELKFEDSVFLKLCYVMLQESTTLSYCIIPGFKRISQRKFRILYIFPLTSVNERFWKSSLLGLNYATTCMDLWIVGLARAMISRVITEHSRDRLQGKPCIIENHDWKGTMSETTSNKNRPLQLFSSKKLDETMCLKPSSRGEKAILHLITEAQTRNVPSPITLSKEAIAVPNTRVGS